MRFVALLFLLSLAVACKDDSTQPQTTMPGAPAAGMPAGHPPMGGAALPDLPTGSISGTVRAADELAGKIGKGDVVFVMARNAATGSLIAVSRVEISELPAAFTLTGGGGMHGSSGLAGKVRVEARLDKDGDAMTKNPGDIVGEVDELVQVPAEDVVLTLTETL